MEQIRVIPWRPTIPPLADLLLAMMTQFTDSGYGIVIGEYGAQPKSDGTLKDNTIDYIMNGRPYTSSDNNICTRVNLYNGWVSKVPSEARIADGKTEDLSAALLNPGDLGEVKTISITFTYGPVE